MMEMKDRLRRLRLKCGLTQQQAADQLGITRQALSGYEGGRTRPDIEMLEKLCRIYETDLETMLYGRTGNKENPSRLKRLWKIWTGVLGELTFISSALLWSGNRFFPVSTGQLTAEERVVFQTHHRLISAWEAMDSLILLLTLVSGILLLWQKRKGRYPLPWRKRLGMLVIPVGAMVLAALPFALTDPVFEAVNYLITPFLCGMRILLLWLVDLAMDMAAGFRKKSSKGNNNSSQNKKSLPHPGES